MPTQYLYNVPGLLAAEFGAAELTQVKTSALLFYEGEHTSMAGASKKWSKRTLEAIASKTAAYLAAGNRIKLYLAPQDHAINQAAAVGLVSNVRLAEITDSTIPMPGQTDLLGKLGLYADVEILDGNAIQQYQKGLLKELSIGLGRDNVIYEVSGVSIPALAGAALFAREVELEGFAKSLNSKGVSKANSLMRSGDVSNSATWDGPTAAEENSYIEANGWPAYGSWFLQPMTGLIQRRRHTIHTSLHKTLKR